jgi:PKD repeat protein
MTAGQSVNFQGTGFDPDGNLPLAYFWDFGGGASNRTVEDPGAVVFGTPGTYTVRFVVTDALSLADPTPDTRVITVSGPVASAADEVHWTLLGQTAVTFDWRGGSDSLSYGPTAAYGQIAIAAVPTPLPWSSAGPFREARVTGLTENTLYHYAIGGGPDHTFRTPPPRGSSGFMVIAEGDIGSSTLMATIQSRIAAQGPDVVLGLGDLTYANDAGQAAVDAHFNAAMVWSRQAPYMPVWGNHDWDPGDDLRNYKGRFDLPNPQASPGAPTQGCCGEDWSWFDYGNARFISYPEPYASGVKPDWQTRAAAIMDAAQADSSIRFIVTFGHRPAFSSGYHSGDTQWQTIMASLAASHSKYVLNLNGHSHDYERSYPQNGVVHITAGTGGQNLEATSGPCLWAGGCPPPAWSAFRAMHHVVLTLRFTSSTIEGVAYCGPADPSRNDIACVEGTVLDTFTIQGPALGAASGPAQGTPPKPQSFAVPPAFSLSLNGPNPFGTTTDFQYTLPVPARVEMSLFSVLGKQVKVLVDEVQTAGVHTVQVDARTLEAAVYFLRLRATGTADPVRRFTRTRKILVMR